MNILLLLSVQGVAEAIPLMKKRATNPLTRYKAKRTVTQSGEPAGIKKTQKKATRSNPIFVIQRHDASHLHYDLRLEIEGVLESWAVPKGPPKTRAEKRLAVMTEPHPMAYADFEGIIPEGNYGAGKVTIWDSGTIENIKMSDGKLVPLKECLKMGRIEVIFNGKRIKGPYALIKTKMRGAKDNSWLFFKMSAAKKKNSAPTTRAKKIKSTSIKNKKKSNDPLIKVGSQTISYTNPDKLIFPKDGITKTDLITYYHDIAPHMLALIKNRLLTLERYPDGANKEGFYQKDMPAHTPDWLVTKNIPSAEGKPVHYAVAKNAATLVYLATQACITPHVWQSLADAPDMPDRIIFDIDPPAGPVHMPTIIKIARHLKSILEEIGLVPFVMTTGSRGLHVVAPIKKQFTFDEVRLFTQHCALYCQSYFPTITTINARKEGRKKKVFIDYLRNSFGATAVAPYALRARPGAPVATPLFWDELDNQKLTSQAYTYFNIKQRLAKLKQDPWHNFKKYAKPLLPAARKLDALMTQHGVSRS